MLSTAPATGAARRSWSLVGTAVAESLASTGTRGDGITPSLVATEWTATDSALWSGMRSTREGAPYRHAAAATVTDSNTAAAERHTVGDGQVALGNTPHQ